MPLAKHAGPKPGPIDVNADLGEGFGNDRALLELVTSANVCCGAHAGTCSAIRQTLCDASTRGSLIGAPSGLPDRPGFGRRDQHLSSVEVIDLMSSQIDRPHRPGRGGGCTGRCI